MPDQRPLHSAGWGSLPPRSRQQQGTQPLALPAIPPRAHIATRCRIIARVEQSTCPVTVASLRNSASDPRHWYHPLHHTKQRRVHHNNRIAPGKPLAQAHAAPLIADLLVPDCIAPLAVATMPPKAAGRKSVGRRSLPAAKRGGRRSVASASTSTPRRVSGAATKRGRKSNVERELARQGTYSVMWGERLTRWD